MTKPVDKQHLKPEIGQSEFTARVTRPFEPACGHPRSLDSDQALEALQKLYLGYDFENGAELADAVQNYIAQLEAENRGLQYELDDANADLRHYRRQF